MMTHNHPLGRRIVRLVGKAIAEHKMIRAGDRVAIGLSGGKDSTTLLHALLTLKQRAPIAFELQAFTVEQGKFLGSLAGLKDHLSKLGVPWRLWEDRPSLNLLRDAVEHGCDLCSRYRRRAVYQLAQEMGANVIAFGHTADDFAEAMLRNLVFTGVVKPLPPVAVSSGKDFRLIRPLLYVDEETIRAYSQSSFLPITPCACSLREGARSKIRGFLESLVADNPHVRSNLVSAGVQVWKERRALGSEMAAAEEAAQEI
ncbi:MAG: PP-loop domain-containing protein [Acidobacteria bacterium]|nr:PP-loop domain-containing protein [Acidobacteriota bacterium]